MAGDEFAMSDLKPILKSEFPKENNLDLIRLLAALQVAVVHGVEHLGMRLPLHDYLYAFIVCFPGVPIFFIISGFLISASYQRSRNLRDFFKNRVLRLFPALWFCFVFTIFLIVLSGYFDAHSLPPIQFVVWVGTQLTFMQFFNPEFLREFGVGAVNGSLWTIPVEMQFYILTPVLMWVLAKYRAIFWWLLAVFVVINFMHNWLLPIAGYKGIIKSLVSVTFMPWLYMYMLGILINVHWKRVAPLLVGKFRYWLISCMVIFALQFSIGVGAKNNTILFPWVLILGGMVMSGAFTKPHLSEKVLDNNDISYGIYIYHMPIYNFVYESGWVSGSQLTWFAVVFSISVAALSWNLIERPVLKLKNYSLRRISNSE